MRCAIYRRMSSVKHGEGTTRTLAMQERTPNRDSRPVHRKQMHASRDPRLESNWPYLTQMPQLRRLPINQQPIRNGSGMTQFWPAKQSSTIHMVLGGRSSPPRMRTRGQN